MWGIALLASLGLGLMSSPAVTAVYDFQDTYHGYDIIYHRQYHLMLAIHGDQCYFVDTPQNKEYTLVGNRHHFRSRSRLQYTERSLLSHILRNSSGEVRATTLEAVRDKYQDLLADFHCLGKQIYEVDFYKTNTGSHGQAPTCEGKSPGLYADPRDCHSFIQCGGYQTFYEKCAPGTAFVPSKQQCQHTRLVPNCHDDDDSSDESDDDDEDKDDDSSDESDDDDEDKDDDSSDESDEDDDDDDDADKDHDKHRKKDKHHDSKHRSHRHALPLTHDE